MLRNIFSHKGKATRREFWNICLACILMIGVFGPMLDKMEDMPLRSFGIFGLVFVVCWLLGAVTGRRCHDLGISTWRQFDPRYVLRIPFGDSRTD